MLEAYGWSSFFAEAFAGHASGGVVPGRVARDHQHIYRVYTEAGEMLARLAEGLDADINLRRIERYLLLAWDSGARPVVLLNKADLCDDVKQRVREVEGVAAGTPVHVVSARLGTGIDHIRPYLRPGETVAVLGSSGVGKCTPIDRLIGEERLRRGGWPVRGSRPTSGCGGKAEDLASRQDVSAQQATKRKWRAIHKTAKKHKPRE